MYSATGPHLIDQVLQLFGRPNRITGFIQNLRGFGGPEVDDTVSQPNQNRERDGGLRHPLTVLDPLPLRSKAVPDPSHSSCVFPLGEEITAAVQRQGDQRII